SRTTPLRIALQQIELRGTAETFPDPSSVTVDCRKLSREERALMLFRHSAAANLAEGKKTVVRVLAPTIVDNSCLTPERIRRFFKTWLPELTNEYQITGNTDRIKQAVTQEINQPSQR